jgi:hypothetical protein
LRLCSPSPASSALRILDPAFVERIVQDDILLWWRSPLPAVLAPVEARQAPIINP